MSKSKYVGSFIDGVYQVAGGSAKSATRSSRPAVEVATETSAPFRPGVSSDGQYTMFPTLAESNRLDFQVQNVIPEKSPVQQVLFHSGPGGESLSPGLPMGSNAIVPVAGTSRTQSSREILTGGVGNPQIRAKSDVLDEQYAPYVSQSGEMGHMAQVARKSGVPIEQFKQEAGVAPMGSYPLAVQSSNKANVFDHGLDARYERELNKKYAQDPVMRSHLEEARRQNMPYDEFSNAPYANERVVTQEAVEAVPGKKGFLGFGKREAVPGQEEISRPMTIKEARKELRSNGSINPVSSSNAGAGNVTPGDMGYAGFSGGFERHAAGAVIGAGMGMMSEGEVSVGGAVRGAMFGVAGGKAARMFTGSMRGGAVNSMARGVGDTLSAAGEGTMRQTAGQFINKSMSGFDGAKSQEAMRMATFAGAGLAGFSMGRDRNHSRGMNGSRGSRF